MTTMTTATSMTDRIEEMMNAEVERRCAIQRAELVEREKELSARRQELDSAISKLLGSLSVSDTASVSSGGGTGVSYTKLTGAQNTQLEWVFNRLRPRSSGVMWAMLRAAYNSEPSRFEIGDGHVSYGEKDPHRTLYYRCPVLKTDGTTSDYIVKIHLYYTEPSYGKQLFTRATALSLIHTATPQEIANFN